MIPEKVGSGRVRAVIERLVLDGSAVSGADGSVHTLFPVAVSAAEGEALRDWVTRERAARTIEVGLGYGISTLFICEGLLEAGQPEAHHVAIDPHQATRFASCGLQFLDEAGVAELVEHREEESQTALPRGAAFMAAGAILLMVMLRRSDVQRSDVQQIDVQEPLEAAA